jgi:N-acetyl-anhydromuramyl-L-alanine amidase AmpD
MRILILLAFTWPSLLWAQTIRQAPLPAYCSSPRQGQVTHVVLHYISNALQNPENPYVEADIRRIFTQYKLSAHYLINRNGEIIQLVPHHRAAFHAGKGRLPHPPHYENNLNQHSIGIEIMGIGTAEEMALLGVKHYDRIAESDRGFTPAQYEALRDLLQQLDNNFPLLKLNRQQVVGHDAYAPGRRGDPGVLFDWGRLELE